MSKKTVITPKQHLHSNTADIQKAVMGKITTGSISMKPRWYFLLGTLLTGVGLLGASILSIFLITISLFLLKQHGPMGEWRLQLMLESFPWWIAVLAVVGLLVGIYFLKKYDFSYRHNFLFIVLSFVIVIMLAAVVIDLSGINDTWFGQGLGRRYFGRMDTVTPSGQRRQGRMNQIPSENSSDTQ